MDFSELEGIKNRLAYPWEVVTSSDETCSGPVYLPSCRTTSTIKQLSFPWIIIFIQKTLLKCTHQLTKNMGLTFTNLLPKGKTLRNMVQNRYILKWV